MQERGGAATRRRDLERGQEVKCGGGTLNDKCDECRIYSA